MITQNINVKTKYSFSKNKQHAVQDLYDAIVQPNMEVVIFFCSSKCNLNILEQEIKRNFDCSIIGSREVTPTGGTIVGVSISSSAIKAYSQIINALSQFQLTNAQELSKDILSLLPQASKFDGLSMLEEQIAASIHNQFNGVSLVGGSTGDDLAFEETEIYADGKFLANAAVFTLFETSLPSFTFKTQHFLPSDKKRVITDSDPPNRIVREIKVE